jgi:hypothetical protein
MKLLGVSIGGVAMAAVVLVGSAPASADPSTAGAGTSSTGPLGGSIQGTGAWNVLVGGNTVNVPYECNATAGGPAVITGIRPADQNGCVLVRNGATVSSAQGSGLPGPTNVATNVAAIPFLNTTSLQVCWRVWAGFVTGDLRETSGCSNLNIL